MSLIEFLEQEKIEAKNCMETHRVKLDGSPQLVNYFNGRYDAFNSILNKLKNGEVTYS